MQSYPAQAANDDAPNFLFALIGFIIPLVGLVLWLIERGSRPQKAMSALKGAGLSLALSIVATVGLLALISASPRRAPGTVAPGNAPVTQPR